MKVYRLFHKDKQQYANFTPYWRTSFKGQGSLFITRTRALKALFSHIAICYYSEYCNVDSKADWKGAVIDAFLKKNKDWTERRPVPDSPTFYFFLRSPEFIAAHPELKDKIASRFEIVATEMEVETRPEWNEAGMGLVLYL